jgi:hypothetical protein
MTKERYLRLLLFGFILKNKDISELDPNKYDIDEIKEAYKALQEEFLEDYTI